MVASGILGAGAQNEFLVNRGGKTLARPCPEPTHMTNFQWGTTTVPMSAHAGGIIKWILQSEREFCSHFAKAIKECDDNSVVLDIGANNGVYGTWAATQGCRVFLFEPQPNCHPSISASMCANAPYRHPPTLVMQPVMANTSDTLTVSTASKCIGSYGAYNSIAKARHHSSHTEVRGANVIELVGDAEVSFMKIDVEGGELSVITHVMPLFVAKKIKTAIIEVTTRFWEQRSTSRETAWSVIKGIQDAG